MSNKTIKKKNVPKKTNFKFTKKHGIIIGSSLLLIAIVCCLIIFLKPDPVLEFLDYDVAYDGEVKLPNYKKYTVNIDDLFEEGFQKYLKEIQSSEFERGEPIEGAVVEEDSIISVLLAVSCGEEILVSKFETVLELSKNTFSKEITEEIKKGFVGKKAGEYIEFTLKGANDVTLAEEYKDKDVTYYCYLINVLGENIYPEITDEFIQNTVGFESIEALRKNYFVESLYRMMKYEDVFYDNLSYFVESSLFNDSVVDKVGTSIDEAYKENIINMIKYYAEYYGYTYERYLEEVYQMTENEFIEEYVVPFSKMETIAVEIALAENIDISDSAYNEFLLDMVAENDYNSIEELRADINYSEKCNKQSFITRLVYRHIIDNYLTIEDSIYADEVRQMIQSESTSDLLSNSDYSNNGGLVDIFDLIETP